MMQLIIYCRKFLGLLISPLVMIHSSEGGENPLHKITRPQAREVHIGRITVRAFD